MNYEDKRTHTNYVVAFTDGSVKIGTTSRWTTRVKEVVRSKIKNNGIRNGISVVAYYMGEFITKSSAYRAERNTCYMNKRYAMNGHREWFKSDHQDAEQLHNYLRQELVLFSTVGLTRRGG